METSGAYSKDLPRIIFVIGDAAVADPPLRHDRVEARIADGISTAAARWLATAGEEIADGGVPAVLLLELLVASAAHVEEYAAQNTGNGDDPDDDTGGDAGCVGRTAARLALCCCAGRGYGEGYGF